MGLLTKELFISTIESIRLQMVKDRESAENIATVFGIDVCYVPVYDNSLLIKSLVSLLRFDFPIKDNFCLIEHYMFDMNFGRISLEEDLITTEDLWNLITKYESN